MADCPNIHVPDCPPFSNIRRGSEKKMLMALSVEFLRSLFIKIVTISQKHTLFFLFCFFLNDDAELPRRYPETNFSSKQCGRGSKLRKDGIRCFFFLFFLQQTLLASLLCKLAAKFYSYTLKSSPMILASLPKIRRFSQIKLLLMPRCPCRISPCVVYIFNIYIYRYEQKRRDFFFFVLFFCENF